jgi:hypothetical protein
MVDTVKIRHLRPVRSPETSEPTAARRPAAYGGLERVVEDVKLALLTPGLKLEGEKGRGQDPYNSRPVARTRDAWSDRNRRR